MAVVGDVDRVLIAANSNVAVNSAQTFVDDEDEMLVLQAVASEIAECTDLRSQLHWNTGRLLDEGHQAYISRS